ncbi:MAG: hypothetical protein WCQ95_02285 [Bacteroidota bacterium]
MGTPSFIPRPMLDFDAWQINFVAVANIHMSTWGLPTVATAEWTLLTTTPLKKKLRWDAIVAIVASGEYKHSDEVEMVKARRDYENGMKESDDDTSLRLFIARYIRFNIKVTPRQKTAMGLTVPDDNKTMVAPQPSNNDLALKVKSATHLYHNLGVTRAEQKSRAMPEGVAAIQLFMALTEVSVKIAPAIEEFAYVGLVKRGLYTKEFEQEQEGKRAWYFVRMMYKGEKETYSAPSLILPALVM